MVVVCTEAGVEWGKGEGRDHQAVGGGLPNGRKEIEGMVLANTD